jgi:hypothetical protein
MLLSLNDWKYPATKSPMHFYICAQHIAKALELVEEELSHKKNMGWFDQYSRLINDVNIKDIILALDSGSIIAVVLTYTPSCGSPTTSNLPWADRIENDVGGIPAFAVAVSASTL